MASLYRHFDAEGRLLYVGIAKNALCRLNGHKKASWYEQLARVGVEHHKSRAHALYAEAIAIRDEQPIYNRNRPKPVDPDVAVVVAEIAEDTTIGLEPAPKRGLFSHLPGAYDGTLTILYTILPEGRRAQTTLDRIAGSVGAYGFATADLDERAGGFIRAIKAAQHEGTRIITDQPHAFDDVCELLSARGVSLVVSNDAWEIAPGGDTERLITELARAQNTANVAAHRRRKKST